MTDRPLFSELYLDYASDITDAPSVYHQWLSYLMMSCAVNRKVWMPWGDVKIKIYPNIWLLIIGPSSSYRKSYSQKMASGVLSDLYPDFRLMDFSSREAFISEMARTDRQPPGSGLILIDELAGFMSRVKASPHFFGMIQDLSSCFDGDNLKRRVGVKEEEKVIYKVENPFLNISAACSYDWLTKSIETSDITGGFLARFLWIVAPEKTTLPWSEPGKGNPAKRSRVVERLTEANFMQGEMTWTASAKEMWDSWYGDFRKRNQGGMFDAYYERLTTQTKKIAMLNAVQDGTLEIRPPHLMSAIEMAEPLVESLGGIAIGDTEDEILRHKIVKYLKKRFPDSVSVSEILNNVRGINSKKFKDAIMTLTEADLVEMENMDARHTAGRKPTRYRLKRPIEMLAGI